MNDVPCNIPCDICGDKPAFWFGNTSVAVCSKAECRRSNQQAYADHCEEMDREFEDEEKMREIYGR